MDEYFDHYLSSVLWSDVNPKESSYWGCCESGQLDEPIPKSIGFDENGKDGSPITIISSNQCLESLAAQDTPTVLINEELDHGLMQALLSTQSQKNDQGLVDLGHPQKQLEEVAEMSRSSRSFTESGLVGCNEPSESQMLSSIPKLWLQPTHEDIKSGFDLQRKHVNNDSDFMRNGCDVLLDEALQYDEFSASISSKEKPELYNNFFSSFPTGPQLSVTSGGFNSLPQATPGTIYGSSNGRAKPRQRARRGQATDPHSIAERLRREKIAERMRNLQELVPNSDKTDKASMLDEILDYVKFLQLQVKVLSMSRSGSCQGSNDLSLLQSAGQADDSQSPDQVAMEQEIVKMMESSMAMAMQYLQNKGLCLMPIALASSISDAKTSSSSSIVSEDIGPTKSLVQNSISSSSNSGTTVKTSSKKAIKQEVSKELKPKT